MAASSLGCAFHLPLVKRSSPPLARSCTSGLSSLTQHGLSSLTHSRAQLAVARAYLRPHHGPRVAGHLSLSLFVWLVADD
jgi:hypothetical protein